MGCFPSCCGQEIRVQRRKGAGEGNERTHIRSPLLKRSNDDEHERNVPVIHRVKSFEVDGVGVGKERGEGLIETKGDEGGGMGIDD